MLKNESESDFKERMALASRVKEALDSLPRGGKKRIAEKCNGGKGINPQALTGWVTSGRVDKNNMVVLSNETDYQLHWLITGKGPKHKVIGNLAATLEGVSGALQGQIDAQAKPPIIDDDTWKSLPPKNRALIEDLLIGSTSGKLKEDHVKVIQNMLDALSKD